MEGRYQHQAAEECGPQKLQQLSRDHAPVKARQGSQQGSTGEDERGFRKNRSCADQIASLRIIAEQSLESNSPLRINVIDYEKAFDSGDRETLWKLLRHYGVQVHLPGHELQDRPRRPVV